MILLVSYKCWDDLTSIKPGDGWGGIIALMLLYLYVLSGLIWEIGQVLKSKEKESAVKAEEEQRKDAELEELRREWKRVDEMQEEAELHHRMMEEERDYYRGKYGIDIDSMEYDIDKD